MNKYQLNSSYRNWISYLILLFMLTGCSVIEGIFKTGVAVGVFLVIGLIIVIVILINRFKKKY